MFYLMTWIPGANDVILDASIIDEKLSLKMLVFFIPLNWIGVLTLSLLLKLPIRKLECQCVFWSFFVLRLSLSL